MVRYVGVDVGATKTAIALGSADGTMQAKVTIPTLPGAPDALADAIAVVIADLRAKQATGPVLHIGIGICGGVDRDGMVHGPTPLAWPKRVDFATLVSERTGIPAAIDNDVNAGARGEHLWGAGRGIDDFLFLALGTGIGAGLVLGGKLYRGARNFAGEIGHLSVDVDGVPCTCGNRGCIEASCGGKAVGDLTSQRLQHDATTPSSLRHVLLERGSLTARDVMDHAEAGDAFALAEVRRVARHLAAAIVGVVNLLDVRRVIVGGGMVQNRVLFPAIQDALLTTRPYLAHEPNLVVPAGLGEDAGVTGALAIAVEAGASEERRSESMARSRSM
ncbi:MAG: ROK family protein [Trueperaceae bacterium]